MNGEKLSSEIENLSNKNPKNKTPKSAAIIARKSFYKNPEVSTIAKATLLKLLSKCYWHMAQMELLSADTFICCVTIG